MEQALQNGQMTATEEKDLIALCGDLSKRFAERAADYDRQATWPIKDYEDRQAGKVRPEPLRTEKHQHPSGDHCYCPYCDIEIMDNATYCEACQSNLEEEH